MDGLLGAVLPFAQQELTKHGEFFPYGAVLNKARQVELIAAYTGSEQPPSADVLVLLIEGARSKKAEIRAAAFVADVRLPDRSDAIRVEIEHQDGHVIAVLLPYKNKKGDGIEYGRLTAAAGVRHVWTATE
jgi:hypothetical protein